MPLNFSAFSAEVTPESVKAEIKSRITQAGQNIDTREGAYTDILISAAAWRDYVTWQMLSVALAAAVPGVDSGPYLDNFGGQFGINRTPAATAHVTVAFTGQDGAVVPAGTVVLTADGLRFSTDLAATISSGSATASATAEGPGEAYNVEPETVTRFLYTGPGVTGVTNPAAGEGGADAESDASYYERIHTRLSSSAASGSGTPAYYEQIARTVPGVGQAKCISTWDGPGTAKIVVASADKQPLDGSVVTQVQQALDAGRVIGAELTAASATALTITVTAVCNLDAGVLGTTVAAELEGMLEEMFVGMEFGTDEPVRYNQIALRLLSCQGVVDYTSLLVNGGSANVAKTVEQVPVVGTVTVTAAGGSA